MYKKEDPTTIPIMFAKIDLFLRFIPRIENKRAAVGHCDDFIFKPRYSGRCQKFYRNWSVIYSSFSHGERFLQNLFALVRPNWIFENPFGPKAIIL